MKRKDNNRGFTLIELVIAVAILAVVVMPLVANFIQSSKMNLKGRKSLNATNLAQDVMEGLSAYSASDVDAIMVSANTIPNNLSGTILPIGTTYDSAAKDVTASTADHFVYNIYGIQTAAGNYNKYDIAIDMKADQAAYKKFNQYEVADIAEIDQYFDAVYTIPSNDVSSAIADMMTMFPQQSKIASDYEGKLVRTTNIFIDDTDTTGSNPNYEVMVQRRYGVVGSASSDLGVPAGYTTTFVDMNVYKGNDEQMPRSVYLYFEGMEEAKFNAAEPREYIHIINTTGMDIDVYLIRMQQKGKEMDNAIYNNAFGCKVAVTSKDPTGADTENVSVISNLRFNLSYPLENNYRLYKEGSTTAKVDREEELDQTKMNYYNASRATYTYNGSVVNEDLYLRCFSDGYQKNEKNMLFDVKVEIYEAGTAKKVGEYTGGISD